MVDDTLVYDGREKSTIDKLGLLDGEPASVDLSWELCVVTTSGAAGCTHDHVPDLEEIPMGVGELRVMRDNTVWVGEDNLPMNPGGLDAPEGWVFEDPPEGGFDQVEFSEGGACGLRDGALTCVGQNTAGELHVPDYEYVAFDMAAKAFCGVTAEEHLVCRGLVQIENAFAQ